MQFLINLRGTFKKKETRKKTDTNQNIHSFLSINAYQNMTKK